MEMQKEKYNQEEGFNPMLLRLGSPILTTSPTDQESPIMFTDSCSMCGSKKRRCLTPSFGQRKKTILIDPTSMKEASSADEGSHSHQISPSFFHQIPNTIPHNSPSLRRSVSDLVNSPSSFSLTGSFSSPKSPENAATTPNQTSSPTNAYFGRSSSFPGCFDTLKSTLPETSPSSSPSFQLPKSSIQIPTDSVLKSDEKLIGDQKDPNCPSSSRGNCKFGVLAATTDHPKHEQFEEGNIKKVQFSCNCGKHYEVQFFD